MLKRFVLIALGSLVVPCIAGAVASCPDRTPTAVTAATAASRKCQETIAKAGAKFLKTKIKKLAKCKITQPASACPTAADTLKIEKAAASAATKINKKCGDPAARAGLQSSYSTSASDVEISSCMLSQHNVVGGLIIADSSGATTESWEGTGSERVLCVKELNKRGVKFITSALKAATKCINKQAKLGTVGNLAPICVGSFASGSYVLPSDPKASAAQAKLIQNTDDALAKKCSGAATLDQIKSIFACAGSTTVADLQKCIECSGLNGMMDAVAQEYAESGSFVAHGAGAIQAAVSAASPGDKLLIESGDYSEEVNVTTDNLSIVGCGGATNDRPRIIPTAPQVTGRGFRATGIDGLTFQSLDFFDQNSDHIFVGQAEGVTFRDITGDGNRNTRYAVFPVNSNNVLVELCRVVRQADAPIYVGQSSTIIVRHNDVREGVSGTEIENSGNAQVYDNYATGNTAGLLVFKDGSLPVQLAQCHSVHHNLFESNNEPNYGAGTVSQVPTGTGILVVSADLTPYSYNLLRSNNTAGLVIVDQVTAEFGPPFSADQSVDGNYIFNNVMRMNGSDPDPDRWPLPFGADYVFLVTQSSNNCESNNLLDNAITNVSNPPCSLPPPAVFPGCPAPPITNTTTTTTTSTTTTT